MMKEPILRIRTRLCMGTPFECAPRRIVINRRPNGDYYCKYSKVNNAGKRVTAERELDSAKVEGVLSQLSSMSLPVAPDFGMVDDGEDVEIEILGRLGKVKFSWYRAAPEEWAVLEEIAYQVVEWSGMNENADTY